MVPSSIRGWLVGCHCTAWRRFRLAQPGQAFSFKPAACRRAISLCLGRHWPVLASRQLQQLSLPCRNPRELPALALLSIPIPESTAHSTLVAGDLCAGSTLSLLPIKRCKNLLSLDNYQVLWAERCSSIASLRRLSPPALTCHCGAPPPSVDEFHRCESERTPGTHSNAYHHPAACTCP